MVPPQTGQFQSGAERVWVEVCVAAICWGSPVLWNRWKQSGRRAARRRLARKPKLRRRTKPRGNRWRRKRRAGMSAAGALIAMSAQRRGAATGDGQQHLLMLPANPSATARYEVVTSTVNDVGHLQRRSVHALRDTPLPLNLAQRHQGWLNHARMRPPLSKRLRSSRPIASSMKRVPKPTVISIALNN
jgi:hypothetical protein